LVLYQVYFEKYKSSYGDKLLLFQAEITTPYALSNRCL